MSENYVFFKDISADFEIVNSTIPAYKAHTPNRYYINQYKVCFNLFFMPDMVLKQNSQKFNGRLTGFSVRRLPSIYSLCIKWSCKINGEQLRLFVTGSYR